MKKTIVTGLLATVIAMAPIQVQCSNPPAHGDDGKLIHFKVGQKYYLTDFIKKEMDGATFIENSRAYVPVRFLGNALGVDNENITYDGSNVTLSKNGKTVGLKIGDNQLAIDGKVTTMDVVPEIKEGRTYLPARFVSEAFGYKVDFKDNVVIVYPDGVDITKPVDFTGKGEPTKGKPFVNMILNDEGTIAYSPISPNVQPIKVGKAEVYGIKIEGDKLTVTQRLAYSGHKGVRVILVDGNNYRPRDSFLSQGEDSTTLFNLTYNLNELADRHMGKNPISNVNDIDAIIFENLGNCVRIDNPFK